ncbi:hypothetical protein [Nannocystis pusilla]|uniref:hypothetical protein n=1 Tax=Nannocystis pusilla TaxID=889268 RepID=UPI003B7FB453
MKINRPGTVARLVAAGFHIYRSMLEIRAIKARRAEAEVEEEEAEEATEVAVDEHREQRVGMAAWRMRLFLSGSDRVFSGLEESALLELQRLREVFRVGAWSLAGLERHKWVVAGIDDAATASRLVALGVRPAPGLADPLTEEEAAAVTAMFGPVSAKLPAELLEDLPDLDGPAAFAMVAARRTRR